MSPRDRLTWLRSLVADQLGLRNALLGRRKRLLKSFQQHLGNWETYPYPRHDLSRVFVGNGFSGGQDVGDGNDAAGRSGCDAEDLAIYVWEIGHGWYLCSYAPGTTTTNWPPIPPQVIP
jgi:hypothetical protein